MSDSYALISPLALFLGYDKIGTLLFDKLLIPAPELDTSGVLQIVRDDEGEKISRQLSDIWLPISRIWPDFKRPNRLSHYKGSPESKGAVRVFDRLLEQRMRQREEKAMVSGRTWNEQAAALSYFQGIKDLYAAFTDARASLNIVRRFPCPVVTYPEALSFLQIENKYVSDSSPFRFVEFFQTEIPNFLSLRYGEILALRQSPHLGTFKKWLNQVCVPELTQTEDFLSRAREQMLEACRRLVLEVKPRPGRATMKAVVSIAPIPYCNPFSLFFGIGDVIRQRRTRHRYGHVFM